MSRYKNKIAIIIPTKDNPGDLRKLLASMSAQTYIPDQIIVVDGGQPAINNIIDEFREVKIGYVRVLPPGLTKQRNAGIREIRADITIAGFLDDDIILEKDTISQLMEFWEKAAGDVGGTSFNITNNVQSPCNIFTKIFNINDGNGGSILRSGISIILSPVEKDSQVKWLCGGATIWRKEILDRYKYDEWFIGCAYPEDVDFSYRVSQKYKLFVLANAKLQHYPKPIKLNKNYQMARSVTLSRYYIVTKYPYFSRFLFFYASAAQVLNNLIIGALTFNKVKLLRAMGSLAGLMNIIAGNVNTKKRDFAK